MTRSNTITTRSFEHDAFDERMRPRSMTVVGTPCVFPKLLAERGRTASNDLIYSAFPPDWMAPELMLGKDYNECVDVFSYGQF